LSGNPNLSERERPMYNKHLGSQVLRTREIERSDQVLEASRVSILTVGTTKRKAENLGDESEEARRKRPHAAQPPIVGNCDGAYGFGPCRQESRISTR
jgi:hypothetical protein